MENTITNAMQKFYDMTRKDPVIQIGERNYKLHGYDPVYEATVDQLMIHTLIGIVEAVKSSLDKEAIGATTLHIHIASETEVFLETDAFGPFLQRHILVESNAFTGSFQFGKEYTPEEFIIALNSQFLPNEDLKSLLTLASSITKETSGTIHDTGVSQKMEIKNGISMREKVEVKNPFKLRPFRTFSEVQQPESQVVFRVHDNRGVTCALYEADGEAWKVEAIGNIKAFFNEHLPDITVIA